MVALAPAVNLKAATVVFGNSNNLLSSVTVPTTTMVLSAAPFCFKALEILETETGGLLIFDKNNCLKITLLKAASVRPIIVSIKFLSAQKTHNKSIIDLHSQNKHLEKFFSPAEKLFKSSSKMVLED